VSDDRGALALVLHSHMPYVEGFGTWPFGEEWLWEAVATVYLPLAELLQRTAAPLTLGLTPVLCDQLESLPGPAGQRLLEFLTGTRRSIHAEDAAGLDRGGEHELAVEVRRAAGDYERAVARLECDRDVLGALAAPAADGPLELWSSAATHALLPLLASDAGLRLQLATGIASHERRVGGFGGGLWLPECAYAPGLERELAAHGVRTVCVDQTSAWGLGAAEHREPVRMPGGVVAVPIDWQTVQLVWNDRSGYPVEGAYRDYHRRTVHDLRPWSNAGAPYRPEVARERARGHARDFVARCATRLDGYAKDRGRPGLLCCALDTELLGHWWYEGQIWLEAVIEAAGEQGVELTSVSEGVERVGALERPLAASSWGLGKDFSTWDSPRVSELAFAARSAELRTVAAAHCTRSDPPAGEHSRRPGLERAARELLAIQSSDWAFQVTCELAADYPQRRVRAHAAAHDAALGALADSSPEAHPALRNLAPDLDIASLTTP